METTIMGYKSSTAASANWGTPVHKQEELCQVLGKVYTKFRG